MTVGTRDVFLHSNYMHYSQPSVKLIDERLSNFKKSYNSSSTICVKAVDKNIDQRNIENQNNLIDYLCVLQAKHKENITKKINNAKLIRNISNNLHNNAGIPVLLGLAISGLFGFMLSLLSPLLFSPLVIILSSTLAPITLGAICSVAFECIHLILRNKPNKHESTANELIGKYLIIDFFRNIYKNLEYKNTGISYQQIAANIDAMIADECCRAEIYSKIKKLADIIENAPKYLFADNAISGIKRQKIVNEQRLYNFADHLTNKASYDLENATDKALIANIIKKHYEKSGDNKAKIDKVKIENTLDKILHNTEIMDRINTNAENIPEIVTHSSDEIATDINYNSKLTRNHQYIINHVLNHHQNLLNEQDEIKIKEQEKTQYEDKLKIAVEDLLNFIFENSLQNLDDTSKQACYQAQQAYSEELHKNDSNLTKKLLCCYTATSDDQKIVQFNSINTALENIEVDYFSKKSSEDTNH